MARWCWDCGRHHLHGWCVRARRLTDAEVRAAWLRAWLEGR